MDFGTFLDSPTSAEITTDQFTKLGKPEDKKEAKRLKKCWRKCKKAFLKTGSVRITVPRDELTYCVSRILRMNAKITNDGGKARLLHLSDFGISQVVVVDFTNMDEVRLLWIAE